MICSGVGVEGRGGSAGASRSTWGGVGVGVVSSASVCGEEPDCCVSAPAVEDDAVQTSVETLGAVYSGLPGAGDDVAAVVVVVEVGGDVAVIDGAAVDGDAAVDGGVAVEDGAVCGKSVSDVSKFTLTASDTDGSISIVGVIAVMLADS